MNLADIIGSPQQHPAKSQHSCMGNSWSPRLEIPKKAPIPPRASSQEEAFCCPLLDIRHSTQFSIPVSVLPTPRSWGMSAGMRSNSDPPREASQRFDTFYEVSPTIMLAAIDFCPASHSLFSKAVDWNCRLPNSRSTRRSLTGCDSSSTQSCLS